MAAAPPKSGFAGARYSVHISPSEWRWVILIAGALTLLAFAPLIWVALRGSPGWQFMGTLHNYLDGATYFSKMMLGFEGSWLVTFQHTPETHGGALIQILYPLLGHAARLTGVPLMVMFHVARVGAAIFMYVALYQLGASIWQRTRTRFIFFGMVSIGAGFGWALAPALGVVTFPDFPLLPEAFPFYSSLVNVHFPLTLACLALLASLFVLVLRPGADMDPLVDQYWGVAGLLSLALAFLYPQALVPFVAGLGLYIASLWYRDRRLHFRLLRWLLAVTLPAVPVALYYFMVVMYNPAMSEWNSQNVTPTSDPLTMALGFGIPLLLALPGIYRGVRRFELDGDRLMLLWLVCMIAAMYLPTNVQRRFAVGMMIPIAYFAARAIEDSWLPRISRRLRRPLFAVLFPLIAISQLMMLFLPIIPALTGFPQLAVGVFLQRDYASTFAWLDQQVTQQSVVMASPVVSAWIPGWTGARVVYGHPYETLEAEAKRDQVESWYRAEAGSPECSALLEQYNVRYVLFGAQEELLGAGACRESLRRIGSVGSVEIYAP
jgi:hypothetical protein